MFVDITHEQIKSLEAQVKNLEELTSNIAAGLFSTEHEAMSLAATAKDTHEKLVRKWDMWIERLQQS